MQNHDDMLAGINFKKLNLTERQAHVWALRAQGITQTQIAKQWGTSRANVCMLEKAARKKIERSKETVIFDEQLHAPLRMKCQPGELLLDIPPRLYRHADQSDIKVNADGSMVIQQILTHAPTCVRENRFVRAVLLIVTNSGQLHVRPLA